MMEYNILAVIIFSNGLHIIYISKYNRQVIQNHNVCDAKMKISRY